ncbi:energy transducer TonB [Candidatus Methylacidithermus pantelleriae]|uniref:Putative Periplasmic protein TonB n=1 Tax=Candidatus Methylacidithermus pantelleriae TaxID=2744239 RepID=A0A8J2BN43_9BACT|nr:energy transducer TonB [Candidatus Methylacidithermus pantelleriae]CAF0692052.1 putative Periplasmic protein TonB [Candidatus Methylacidithermus pantelleriae]
MHRDDWLAAGISILFHAWILFGGMGLWVEQAQFGMLSGGQSAGTSNAAPQVDAELVEAPPEENPPVVQDVPPPVQPNEIPDITPPKEQKPNLSPPSHVRAVAKRVAIRGTGRSGMGVGKNLGTGTGTGSGVIGAAYLYNPPPPYPPLAQAEGREGRVILRVRVSAQGLPISVGIEKSSGYRDLDESACHCVQRCWRFRPMRVAGIPVESEVTVPIRFQLRRG